MKPYKLYCLIFIVIMILIFPSCSNKPLSKEELYNQGISYFEELKLDEARQIFLDLRDYNNSSDYYYQVVNLQTIWHLQEVVSVNIEEEQTTAFVKLDNGDLYLYSLKGKEIDKKLLIDKGNVK